MTLFERLKNKRYDLQEAPIDDKGNITPEPGEVEKSKKILKKFVKKQKKIENKNIKSNQQQGDQLLKDINKRKSADLTRADAINRSMGTSGSTEGAGGANTGTTPPKTNKITTDADRPKTKTVNQADVSKKAKEFTKEIEKKRVKKLAPIDLNKPTKRVDLRKVDKKISRKRPSNAPSLADVKKKIDIKNPVEVGATGPKPVKGTVLKVDKGKFKRVRKTKVSAPGGLNPEAQKILKKQISTDELLGNQKKIEKKIVNNTKNTPKPNLFSKVKSKIKGFHNFMVKDAGTRKTSEFAGYGRNVTRTTYKNTLKGNTLKNINKILPGKYKGLALAVAGTAIAVDQALKNRKAAASGVDTKKPVYKKAVKTLNLDTGKKNN